jgi:hypothetical protein
VTRMARPAMPPGAPRSAKLKHATAIENVRISIYNAVGQSCCDS